MQRVLMSGAVINFVLVIAGGLFGVLLKKGIPQKVQNTLMEGMAFCVLFIGITGLFGENVNVLMVVISVAIGAVIGELADLDRLINKLGKKIETRFNKNGSETKIAEGFVAATLLFCVGAMAIVGSIDSGISGDNSTLYSKSLIDGISAAVLGSTLGIGVALSAFPVLLLEGTLTLLAAAMQSVLNEAVITHISVVGSLLIIAISLNMMGLTKIKVMNLVPAIFLPIILCLFIK